jgi:hypothetical protein
MRAEVIHNESGELEKVPSSLRHNCCDRHEMAQCRSDERAQILQEMDEEPACR